MATIALYYMPGPGDPAKTSVADGRFQFAAYQATAMPIDDGSPWQAVTSKLLSNPWFNDGLDLVRQQAWLDSLTKT